MTGLGITIDDENPLISYQPPGAWTRHNSNTDENANNFYGKTYAQTKKPGATMTFTFEGVGVAVYGSKNVDHGEYTVNIDGNNRRQSGNTTAAEPVLYQTPLFLNDSLAPGPHTLTILNLQEAVLDIGITWTSNINRDNGGTLVRSVVDDAEPAFHYQANVWTSTPSNMSTFYGGTGHVTVRVFRQFYLHSDAVSLFGTVGPNNSPYTVQLDDHPPRLYVATQSVYNPRVLLFYESNIGAGNHTLHVLNQANALLEIDYAEVYTLPIFLNGTSDSTQSGPVSTQRSNLSNGAIAGIVIGAAIGLSFILLIGVCLFIGLRKRSWIRQHEHSATEDKYMDEIPPSSVLSEDANLVTPFRLLRPTNSTHGPLGLPIMKEKKQLTSDVSTVAQTASFRSSALASTMSGGNTLNAGGSHGPWCKSRTEMTGVGAHILPRSALQQAHTQAPAEFSATPIDSIPEVLESLTDSSRHRSPVVSQPDVHLIPTREPRPNSEVVSEMGSVWSSPPMYPGAPGPTLLRNGV